MQARMNRCSTTLAAALTLLGGFCLPVFAQEANPTTVAPGATKGSVIAEGPNGIYVYHVNVVERNLDAVNYLNRSGSTKISFVGTNLLPQARGEAKVNAVTGKTNISVKFDELTPANGFGKEYLTYVLWAISVDGRPQNLGELELAGEKANLDVSTAFQSFGLIVTAEPYYAVSQPSDVVVLQNVFTDETRGQLQQINAHYHLLPRGLYANTPGSKTIGNPVTDREHTPLALYEARNAERIALSVGADKYAPDIMKEVSTDLQSAEDINSSKNRDVKMLFTYARQATQRAEDARILTLRKQAAERSQQEIAAKEQAQQQAAAAQAQAQADQAAAARSQAAADQAAAARAQAEAQAAAAQAQAAAANQSAEEARQQAIALREKLRAQLNTILQTTETDRGLVVNISDVLFDTGKYTLKQGTQISLAKIATILQLHPSLHMTVEGYTDSTGSPAFNQKLSDNRAVGVRDFLVENGVSADNITAKGYGATNFVADNGTAAGRAQNRRVDLIVAGDAIGVPVTSH
jgi:outer membrane protein OmpA-like peptidoglycan-associated protein